eukprot:TRINITY_DN4233_c0_g1_i1.p2 TRINITY_DN4233_c0_g1~~TRINITY_DN4233_c0_g1_i1.p2  ORF type:complete len:123 (+),score=61.95 TRINITY_DN4233_c0_g1_i1:230-598(+)
MPEFQRAGKQRWSFLSPTPPQPPTYLFTENYKASERLVVVRPTASTSRPQPSQRPTTIFPRKPKATTSVLLWFNGQHQNPSAPSRHHASPTGQKPPSPLTPSRVLCVDTTAYSALIPLLTLR